MSTNSYHISTGILDTNAVVTTVGSALAKHSAANDTHTVWRVSIQNSDSAYD